MVITHDEFRSPNDLRNLRIWLPDNYWQTEERFPVTYFLEFNRYFGITDEDVFDDVVKRKLETKGLNLKGNLAHEIDRKSVV